MANIDHSPSIGAVPARLGESPVYRCHQQMAAWASPAGKPPLYPSYTEVYPGPLPPAGCGYNVISADRRTIYLHLLRNERGKTGLPAGGELVVRPLAAPVRAVRWVNGDTPLAWQMRGKEAVVSLAGVEADPVDTIVEVELTKAYPGRPPAYGASGGQPGQKGNLAYGKPARLLSADGSHLLPASAFHFAQYGVDGLAYTSAQGGNEWAWTYEVDLEKVQPVERVAISFGAGCWATEYAVLLSADGREWTEIARVEGGDGKPQEHRLAAMPARWVRVRAIKPDGPGQPGAQMSIAELVVEGSAQRPGAAM